MSVKQDLDRILDVFGGVDGGVAFARLRSFLDEAAKEAMDGGKSAAQLLDVVHRFRLLIDAVDR